MGKQNENTQLWNIGKHNIKDGHIRQTDKTNAMKERKNTILKHYHKHV